MQEKLISIIIPIYKVEEYLNQCIDSIINQTYKNIEIILVDDGSPDNCGKICDEYANKDKRIKVIHKKNGGLSSARNAGLNIATGEYISFIDSDDYVSASFVEILYNLCEENSADIAECDFIRFSDKIVEDVRIIKADKYSSIEMQERLYSEDSARTVIVCNKLYKKNVYQNLRFPVGKIHEDEFVTYKAFDSSSNEIVVTNIALYYYRYNENSITGEAFNIKRLDAIEAFEERKQYYFKKGYSELYRETVLNYQELLKKIYLLTRKHIEEPEEHLRYIHEKIKENYMVYKMIYNRNFRKKIIMYFFLKFPNMYHNLTKVKDVLLKNKRV